ncbi:helicase-exonuclease AddAB subunit AddA [Carboxydothermus hydrogenoformans]|uniref:ATP-dependent helicase/nuclease subunit A n=1 Tax=Carboxydothermus hydrogenoformans (strain ATCC BAA-161 / DSM 6008 / Z-2901) TaxID=246194 RepID=ADDA_CARHZ|nr:helicase-exonuclease AddAB subunit AddA [Carboxydothermus hydrogenoformans]Q3AA35.1 RecName: Full=ATP-dependent helicase/nuclease subunit A; AltName: Full=ATP-dependent helicase/nuclease AddA; AltName: Full=DNA 3'-5' helicase AddA [Carboxydothermus hydrogenoformans Z-2901]ABB14602.1 exonuclease RexA [Carboxydothermus hydrogenoformans Z-2901]
MKNWTAEQMRAITSRGNALLVSAAAGAGKTSVLVERVLSRVLTDTPPVDIDRLLVVTFTEAAAGEMKERLGTELLKRLNEDPGNSRILEQLELLPVADISTLHSFCHKIIRKYGRVCGYETKFAILEGPRETYLKNKVLEEILEERYEKGDRELFALLEYLNDEKNDRNLKELILNLYHFSRSNPEPEKWLLDSLNLFNGNWERFEDTFWYREIKSSTEMWLEYILELLGRAKSVAEKYGQARAFSLLAEDMEKVRGLYAKLNEGYEAAKQYLSQVKFGTFSWGRGVGGKDEAKDLRDKAKEQFETIKKRYFSWEAGNFREELRTLTSYLDPLVKLVREFSRKYQEEKRKHGFADFSDLEHWALDILKSGVYRELREKYVEILVDEYQDINGLQEEILTYVSRDGQNLFMVGDVKQSIYRFRWARPEIFLKKYEDFTDEKKIELSLNFRSREEIIATVNFIFKQIMKKRVAELSYDEKAFLKKGADYLPNANCFAELHLIEGKPEEDINSNGEPEEDLTAVHREARLVAAKILKLKEEGFKVFDRETKEFRPLQYRDIVILSRSLSNSSNIWQEELTRAGIPVYVEGAGSFLNSKEILLMTSFLKVIDNPCQDVPLAAVLCSPVAGLTYEELWQVRKEYPEGLLYDALKNKSLGKDELSVKSQKFLELLVEFQKLSRQISLAELVNEIYRKTNLPEIFGAYPGGEVRQANLKLLHDLAVDFAEINGGGIYNFLTFLSQAAESEDFSPAKLIGEADDVVRVMSVHKSKGLEFPVVFVVGLGKRFKFDYSNTVFLHSDLGFGPKFFDPEKRIRRHSIASQILSERMRRETLAEEMRILYVALTRAREKLILVGTVKNLAKKMAGWQSQTEALKDTLSDGQIARAGNFLDWIGPVVFREGSDLPDCLKVEVHPQQEKIEGEQWELPEVLRVKLLTKTPFTEETDYTGQFRAGLEFNYPGLKIAKLPAKMSVSDLKEVFSTDDVISLEDEDEVFLPGVYFEDGAMLGIVYHEFLRRIDFQGDLSASGLKAQGETLVAEGVLPPESREMLDFTKIARIFATPLGQRILRAREIYPEFPFTLGVKAGEIYPEATGFSEKILVRGVIDLLALEEDGFFIVDWKTDRVTGDILNERLKEYAGQLNLYARAVEEITGKKVKEKYLYFINLEKEVRV